MSSDCKLSVEAGRTPPSTWVSGSHDELRLWPGRTVQGSRLRRLSLTIGGKLAPPTARTPVSQKFANAIKRSPARPPSFCPTPLLHAMETGLLRRPVIDLLSGRSQCLFALNTAARRHESSYRRTKHRLNVKPDSSFLLSNNSHQQDHIVFNPPSSAPSVQHTPLIFLPKEDKRRQLFAATAARTPAPTRLPPVIQKFKPVGVRHHLTEKDIEEIRKLRSSDPFQWSAAKLARKFNCSMFFVKMCCEAPEEKKELERQKLEALRARWGPKRRRAREDMLKRKELALRDE